MENLKEKFEILGKSVDLAIRAHEGQLDKRGVPFIRHPLRVMSLMHSIDEMICGVLHDVLEDTDCDITHLKALGIPDNLINVVDILTHKKGVDYFKYIKNVQSNELARKVKLADLTDNMDPERNFNVSEELLLDLAGLLMRHKKAYDILSKSDVT